MIIYNARSINFHGFSAHSLQILHMVTALNNELGTVLLVAKGQKDVVVERLEMMYPNYESLPNIEERFVFKNAVYYTRNLNSALLHFFLFRRQILELHHQGSNKLYLCLLRLVDLGRFLAVTNTKALKNYYSNYISNVISCHNGFYPYEQNTQTGDFVLHSGSLYKFDLFKFANVINKIASQGLRVVHVGGTEDEINSLQAQLTEANVDLYSSKSFAEVRVFQNKAKAYLYYLDSSDKNNRITSPLKLFEYVSTEKPIVSIGCGSIAEILEEDSYYSYDDFMNIETIPLLRPNLSSSFDLRNWEERAKFILSKL